MAIEETSQWRGRIPADIDRPEPVLFNLTARQCLIIVPALAGLWGAYVLLREHVHPWVLLLGAALVLGLVFAIALGERDGQGLEKVAVNGIFWMLSVKHLVPAPSGKILRLPRWSLPGTRSPRMEPLRLPASAITDEGIIDLEGRCAVMIACTTLPFHLASGREQDQILAAFAGVLDSLTEPTQILIYRRSADLTPLAAMIRDNAAQMPYSALADAGHAHAEFLDELSATHELSYQQVVVVLTAAGAADRSGTVLRRRAADTADRLATLGIRTQVLDGEGAEQALRQAMTAPGAVLTDSTDEEDQ